MSTAAPLETSIVVWGDRNAPASAAGHVAQAIEQTGAVDRLALSDQLLNFFPRPLWKPEVMPMAALAPDPDSLQEAWTTAGYILASAPSMGFTLLSDSIRRGPAEFVQAMLTLANMTEGRAMFQIGAGEVKNITPYGYKRRGLGRMEDLFRLFHAVWDSQGQPFDFDGNFTTMRGATLGGAHPHRPEIWGLGEGPKLLDHVTSYADGISSVMPVKYPTAEKAIERRDKVRTMLERKDRDPEKFRSPASRGSASPTTSRRHSRLAVRPPPPRTRSPRPPSVCRRVVFEMTSSTKLSSVAYGFICA